MELPPKPQKDNYQRPERRRCAPRLEQMPITKRQTEPEPPWLPTDSICPAQPVTAVPGRHCALRGIDLDHRDWLGQEARCER